MKVQNYFSKGNPVRGERVLERYYCLAAIFRRLLDEHDTSVPEIEAATNLPRSSMYEWLIGVRPYLAEDVIALAKYFGIHRDELEFGALPKDKELQAEIEKLKNEIEKKSRQIELNQLDLFSYQEALEKSKAELENHKQVAG